MTARIGVITFPGSLDDRDAQRAVRLAGAEPVALWHGSHDLEGVDALILPGGFSYGDYLRCGAIASLSPIMTEVVDAANRGMPVLGICNGFQMLTEAHLLEGGLIRNDHGTLVCRDQVGSELDSAADIAMLGEESRYIFMHSQFLVSEEVFRMQRTLFRGSCLRHLRGVELAVDEVPPDILWMGQNSQPTRQPREVWTACRA